MRGGRDDVGVLEGRGHLLGVRAGARARVRARVRVRVRARARARARARVRVRVRVSTTPAATRPEMCAMSAIRYAPTCSG